MDICDFGRNLNTECHKLTSKTVKGYLEFKKLGETEQEILLWRAGLKHQDDIALICNHHLYFYTAAFERKFDKCCDIFTTHKKKIKGQLLISGELARNLDSKNIHVIPGWRFCRGCYKKADDIIKLIEENHTKDPSFDPEVAGPSKSEFLQSALNESLDALNESPVRFHRIPLHQRASKAKSKLKKVVKKLEKQVSSVYHVDVELNPSAIPCSTDNAFKATDLKNLTVAMKVKLKDTDYTKKVQILTLTPESWSRTYAASYFGVSEYLIRKSRQLKKDKGILALPSKTTGKEISKETIDLVKLYYQDDEYTRQMPGKKDYVSDGTGRPDRVHMQKRLLLCNLRELYFEYKERNPNAKIGFSKFCSLRPKWCIVAGSSGTHSVCVCTYHQNTILLLSAIKWEVTYKDLIAMVVCDPLNNECMIHRCKQCPGTDTLKAFLDDQLKDMDFDEEISFNQWESVDRTALYTRTVSVEDYNDLIVASINNLTSHSYIAKSQANYLKKLKDELKDEECIVLGDFAENYEFVIQDEIQSYHWAKDSCTLHPVVVYFKVQGEDDIKHKSFCYMSDDRIHDTCFVYQLQKLLTEYIKVNMPGISKLYYFSDGCGAQYKNYKNFLNLCNHFNDFGLEAEWVFFATSHGKSPCDGIGGTVKRTTAKASLQRTTNNQILNVNSMYEFCINHIENICFTLIPKETMIEVRKYLAKRFANGKTVPGTRSYHHYVPTSNTTIACKRVSEDTDVQHVNLLTGRVQTAHNQINIQDVQQFTYISCKYDSFWWVGMIIEIDEAQQEIKIKLMHPHGPSMKFSWPSRDDLCWIPVANIMTKVEPPTTRSRRLYEISQKDFDNIVIHF